MNSRLQIAQLRANIDYVRKFPDSLAAHTLKQEYGLPQSATTDDLIDSLQDHLNHLTSEAQG